MIQVDKLNKSFPGPGKSSTPLQVLKEVSFDVKENQFVSIIGQSGSGKSTLLNMMGLLDTFDSGDIVVAGKSLKKLKKTEHPHYRNKYIGFVFQSHHLMPEITVLENIIIPLLIMGISKRKANKKGEEVAELVFTREEMKKQDILKQKPTLISGGQRQRAAIARSLINDPKIILADEPTGSLDEEWGKEVFSNLMQLKERTTIIMVTHNPMLANKTDGIFGITRGVIEKWPKFEDLRVSIDEMSSKYKMEKLVCPRCEGELKITYIGEKEKDDPGRVEIDVCKNCFGIWLDRGEMEMITRNYASFVSKLDLTKIHQDV